MTTAQHRTLIDLMRRDEAKPQCEYNKLLYAIAQSSEGVDERAEELSVLATALGYSPERVHSDFRLMREYHTAEQDFDADALAEAQRKLELAAGIARRYSIRDDGDPNGIPEADRLRTELRGKKELAESEDEHARIRTALATIAEQERRLGLAVKIAEDAVFIHLRKRDSVRDIAARHPELFDGIHNPT